MVDKAPLLDKDRDDKLIDTTTMQYQEMLKAYQDWSNKDRKAYFTMLYCMCDDLIREFEACHTNRNMCDKLRIRFSQISTTRLRTLHLKWM